ncbi:phytanoyl-CoA dioxygenase [Flavobacterium beibuense]|uniref:Phytanoyl-CoA dioxygenase n=1 Tax=Flavobacterium beibuense TaxID=657326 RepID=A0A444WFG8_9FLAO|nr:phytanoyl-CoA dioxygenase [Flavobacterium beibuense]RYJ44569.1 phytanoyl-CoA dioxygenase [Flavobacterium beibuense]
MSYHLNKEEIQQFIQEGFIRINNAFSATTAHEAINILWTDIPFNRRDPKTWTQPVIRLGMYTNPPFIESVNTPKLYNAFNQLIGEGKWLPCMSVGTFPIRFPSSEEPNDTGKHVDVSFPGTDPNNYFEWRANIKSKGRALLMLVLYSDVEENDAPTIIYKSSHLDVAGLLNDYGDEGLSFMEIANSINNLPERETVLATGKAGTVYLCHPFLVHSAQAHKGTEPKFMAQPPLLLKSELRIEGNNTAFSPVEQAIRLALK